MRWSHVAHVRQRALLPWVVAACTIVIATGWTVSPRGDVRAGPSPRDYYSQATALAGRGRCAQAIPLFSKAIKLNPIYVSALQGRAQCAQLLGAYDVAIADLTTALGADPNNYGLLLARANVEIANGSTGRAQIDSLAALRLVPPQVPSYLTVAQMLYSVADLADAARALSLAILLLPRDAALYAQRGTYEAAMYDYTSALADDQRAIGLAAPRDQPDYMIEMAHIQDQAQDFAAAWQTAARAIALRPHDVHFYLVAAGIAGDAGDFTNAAVRYRQAISQGAHSTDALQAWEGYGDALAQLGKKSQAAAAYRAAMAITPDRAPRARLRAKVKALG